MESIGLWLLSIFTGFKTLGSLQYKGGACHNPFLDYSPNSPFLFRKLKKKHIWTKNKNKIQKIITVRRECQSALEVG
jgi:hypothetical protein